MTPHDHFERVKKLAEQARAWEDQTDPYMPDRQNPLNDPHPTAEQSEPLICHCRTCGVANAHIRGALAARGWTHAATHHVRVEGYDFRGGCDPYLAVVKVEGDEIHRAYNDLTELLDDAVLSRVEAALRRHVC